MMVFILLTLAICISVVVTSSAIKEDDVYFPKFKIPNRAKEALSVASVLSFVVFVWVGMDIWMGNVKPSGKIAFRQARFVPLFHSGIERPEAGQQYFRMSYEEYSFWGMRKKGGWPARWMGEDRGWEIFRNGKWLEIHFDSSQGEDYGWDNRGPYSH